MKLVDLILVFLLITLPFQWIGDKHTDQMAEVLYKKCVMNRILDTAVEDGVRQLILRGTGSQMSIDKVAATKAFYNTLYLNFGIMDDAYEKNRIAAYIPVIAIIDYDGFALLTNEQVKDKDGFGLVIPVWQPKIHYTATRGNYVYGFTLDDYVTVYDVTTQQFYEGNQKELKFEIPAELLQDDSLFDRVRRRTIIESLQTQMALAINNHNSVAKSYGITYQFTLPVIADEDWAQTIDDVGMLAFFQGMPMGINGACYNDFALGGAKLIKGSAFYLQTDAVNGLPYYHRASCPQLTNFGQAYPTQAECALEGAFPCEVCRP